MTLYKKTVTKSISPIKISEDDKPNKVDNKICCPVCHKCFSTQPSPCQEKDCPFKK